MYVYNYRIQEHWAKSSIKNTMKKNELNFWVDLGLFVVLAITVLTALVEVALHCFVHVFLGLLLSAGAVTHVALHWKWVVNAFKRFPQLPFQVRTSLGLNLALFFAYTAAGIMGLIARTFLILGPLHIIPGIIHVMLVFGVLLLQTIHLTRHWKWVTMTVKRMAGVI